MSEHLFRQANTEDMPGFDGVVMEQTEPAAEQRWVVPVEIDYENPMTYLHATIWSLRNDWEADRPMPNEDELQHWVERIMALGIEGGDDGQSTT